MARKTPRWPPSPTFVGALLGILGSQCIRPRLMLTALGEVLWLLVWAGSGLLMGAFFEAVVAHGGKAAGSRTRWRPGAWPAARASRPS